MQFHACMEHLRIIRGKRKVKGTHRAEMRREPDGADSGRRPVGDWYDRARDDLIACASERTTQHDHSCFGLVVTVSVMIRDNPLDYEYVFTCIYKFLTMYLSTRSCILAPQHLTLCARSPEPLPLQHVPVDVPRIRAGTTHT